MQILIPYNVPSSKNGRMRTKKGRFIPNKRVREYVKKVEEYFIKNKELVLEELSKKEKPYKIGFHFIRDSHRKYDWVNPVQTIQDLMVKYKWLEDDNIDILIPYPFEIEGKYSSYSKEKEESGVIIEI